MLSLSKHGAGFFSSLLGYGSGMWSVCSLTRAERPGRNVMMSTKSLSAEVDTEVDPAEALDVALGRRLAETRG